jgi:hypothetical protein
MSIKVDKFIKISLENRQIFKEKRINKIVNFLNILKSECGNTNFRLTKFFKEHKQEHLMINAIYKIGFLEKSESDKYPFYKWIGEPPTKADAKFIIEFLNSKAKERQMLY